MSSWLEIWLTSGTWETICCRAVCCCCLRRIRPERTSDGTTSRSRKNSERRRAISANELWKSSIERMRELYFSAELFTFIFLLWEREQQKNRRHRWSQELSYARLTFLNVNQWIILHLSGLSLTDVSSFWAQNQIFSSHWSSCKTDTKKNVVFSLQDISSVSFSAPHCGDSALCGVWCLLSLRDFPWNSLKTERARAEQYLN